MQHSYGKKASNTSLDNKLNNFHIQTKISSMKRTTFLNIKRNIITKYTEK